MKAYLLSFGQAAEKSLPSVFTAFAGGLTKEVPAVSVLRVLSDAPFRPADALLGDLQACSRLMSGGNGTPFFRTLFSSSVLRPVFPDRASLSGEASGLLLSALRGADMPLSFRTDREAVEWAFSSLLEEEDSSCAPLLSLRDEIRTSRAAGEEVRVMLLCDLCDGFSAGSASAAVRFLRSSLGEDCPFLGMILGAEALGVGAQERLSEAREALRAFADRGLIRTADHRPTSGADAAWLLSLPLALGVSEDARRLLSYAAARILGEAFSAPEAPSAGMHTREMPGSLSLSALGEEAACCAAFLRAAVWCLTDLFPSLHQFLDHPALLRSLAPATRNGLFRKLFRSPEGGISAPETLPVLERAMKVMLLEGLSLLRTLPAPLRDPEKNAALWAEAVRACGQTVTLASEYDVRRKEAEESGVDQVAPVHRDSMADTQEEEFLRKLDDMAADLSGALSRRSEIFRQIGGYRARQALEDCLSRCLSAEDAAREKLRGMPSDSPEERFALAVQERRVRLLKAAVSRCEADLREARQPDALRAQASVRPAAPFSGEILSPDCAERCFSLITSDGESGEDLRFLRDSLPSLLSGFSLSDTKSLLKGLIAACRTAGSAGSRDASLRSLMTAVFSVCLSETASLRFPPSADLPFLPLLPDLSSSDRFFTVPAAAGQLLAPEKADPAADRRGLLAMLLLRQYRRRGAEEASVAMDPVLPEDSVLSRVYLSSRNVSRAWIISLSRPKTESAGPAKLPFAVFLPGIGVEPAFRSSAHAALVPPFVFWFRPDSLTFEDPCPYLSEGDRQILTEQCTRLRALLKEPFSRPFTDFLSDWHRDIVRAKTPEAEDPLLSRRLKAACGLQRLPAWQGDLARSVSFFEHSLPRDALCACLLPDPEPDFPAARCDAPDDVLYTFRGIPFARESGLRLLESLRLPEETRLLSSLNAEAELLARASDDYHEALIRGLTDLLGRYPSADPGAVNTARALLEEAREPITDQETELLWPWDTMSSSVLTILTECLGKELGPFALRPFSDRLTVFPARGGQMIGDALLSRMCVLGDPAVPQKAGPVFAENSSESYAPAPAASAPEGYAYAFAANDPAASGPPEADGNPPGDSPDAAVRPDAVLPPLSEAFASALCRLAEGRTLLQEGFLRFEREEQGIRSVLTLEGAFTLRLVRVWREDETVSLYTHDMPTVALWPSVPFRREDWHAYFVYAHLPEGFDLAVSDEQLKTDVLSGSAQRFAELRTAFPLCFFLRRENLCLGSLPNLLPTPEMPSGGAWTACLDFGSAGSSVIFSSGETRWPLRGHDMVRTVLRSPAASEELLWQEFMPSIPLSPILPGALRIFRNTPLSGAEENASVPFRDGSILLSSSLRDVLEIPSGALYTDLKWNAEKGRAAGIYLHQLMLMAALQARCGGASSLGWRAAVPDEMGTGGRENLVSLLSSLALRVAEESGLSLPPKSPPVSFASESAALGAYFRLCSPDETRGGFLLLDLGADTADISLFLRGRENAVRSCQLPLGVHYMLLPSLLARPGILSEDFSHLSDPVFQQDLSSLLSLLESARTDAAALRQSRYALDAFIADYAPLLRAALAERMAAQSPGRTGALLLLHFAYLMMLAGLVLLQVSEDPGRNDFLPERMSLCLSGRGAGLMESLSDRVKTSLWRILTMFRNPKVSSLSLLFSAEKKLEIPVGLSCLKEFRSSVPQAAPVPVSISVRPEELLPEFLSRFRREFPAEAFLLFPSLYSNDPFAPFTPQGLELISESLRSAFRGGETLRPYSALSACLSALLEL